MAASRAISAVAEVPVLHVFMKIALQLSVICVRRGVYATFSLCDLADSGLTSIVR